jgi:hypothetical protein
VTLWTGVDDHDRRLGEALAVEGFPEATVNKARKGYWSDFKSPLDLPKMELVGMLERHGKRDLIKRVTEGEFDG